MNLINFGQKDFAFRFYDSFKSIVLGENGHFPIAFDIYLGGWRLEESELTSQLPSNLRSYHKFVNL